MNDYFVMHSSVCAICCRLGNEIKESLFLILGIDGDGFVFRHRENEDIMMAAMNHDRAAAMLPPITANHDCKLVMSRSRMRFEHFSDLK